MKKLIILIALAVPATLTVKNANAQYGGGGHGGNCSDFHVPPPVLHFLKDHPHLSHYVMRHPNFIKNYNNHSPYAKDHPRLAKLIKNHRGVLRYIAFHYQPCGCKGPQLPNNTMVTENAVSWPSAPNSPAPPAL
jgi:hypothetical protein